MKKLNGLEKRHNYKHIVTQLTIDKMIIYRLRKITNKAANATIAACCLIALNFACTWQHSEFDEGGGVLPIPKQEEQVQEEQVTLKLVIQEGLNQTKAALNPGSLTDPNEEKQLGSVDVFVFNQATGVVLYKAPTSSPHPENDIPGAPQVVDVELQVLPTTVSILFLANSEQAVSALQYDDDTKTFGGAGGNTLSDVALVLRYSVTQRLATEQPGLQNNVTQYDSNNPVPIPMWGQLDNVVVRTPANGGIKRIVGIVEEDLPNVRLLRMIARIDIALDNATSSASYAELGSYRVGDVVLYNHSAHGRVIPDYPGSGSWGSFRDQANLDALIVVDPALYEGGARNQEIDSLRYTRTEALNNYITSPETSTIYAFEAYTDLPTGQRTLQTCLVVELLDGAGAGPSLGFYRIDFDQATAQGIQRIPILRNHHYKILIKSINGTGLDTPREALEGPVGLDVVIGYDDDNVIDWEEETGIGGDELKAD
jgi:hypothetical protein